MGKKYYCDFCDKCFVDNPKSRKNHFRGVYHQRLKKQHYELYKDPINQYGAEKRKQQCRVFFSTGSCRFGNDCMYSHLTPEEKEDLFTQAKSSKITKVSKAPGPPPSLDDWLKKWHKKHQKSTADSSTVANSDIREHNDTSVSVSYTLPQFLEGRPDLPISLIPPTPSDLQNIPCEEWG